MRKRRTIDDNWEAVDAQCARPATLHESVVDRLVIDQSVGGDLEPKSVRHTRSWRESVAASIQPRQRQRRSFGALGCLRNYPAAVSEASSVNRDLKQRPHLRSGRATWTDSTPDPVQNSNWWQPYSFIGDGVSAGSSTRHNGRALMRGQEVVSAANASPRDDRPLRHVGRRVAYITMTVTSSVRRTALQHG